MVRRDRSLLPQFQEEEGAARRDCVVSSPISGGGEKGVVVVSSPKSGVSLPHFRRRRAWRNAIVFSPPPFQEEEGVAQ